jgi:hypothetical protein
LEAWLSPGYSVSAWRNRTRIRPVGYRTGSAGFSAERGTLRNLASIFDAGEKSGMIHPFD